MVAMNPKLKKGCGIGCGLLSIVLFLIMGSLGYFIHSMGQEYKEVAKTEKELLGALESPAGYVPPAGGLPRGDRVQLFLEIRQSQAEWRTNVANAFTQFLVRKNSGQGPFRLWSLFRATTEMAPSLAGFWTARNKALLEKEMGLGEYAYLYCLAYYSYLGYDPGDGAQASELALSGPGLPAERDPSAGSLTPDQRRDASWKAVHDLMLPMLAAASLADSGAVDAEGKIWRDELKVELSRMRESSLHYPWSQGAPRVLSDVFRPYRRGLEQQYSLVVNPVELIFEGQDASR